MSFTPNDITHTVESIAVPVQEIHIESMEFQNALEKELLFHLWMRKLPDSLQPVKEFCRIMLVQEL